MEIGLGAQRGSDAEIQDGRFRDGLAGTVLLVISLVLAILTILFFAARYLAKAYRQRKAADQVLGNELQKQYDSL